MTVKLIDAFIFYNEIDLLIYRLNLLNDIVDKFIIVEGAYTFVGKPKKSYYLENIDKFEKFKDKITHIIIEDFPHIYPDINIENKDQWENEIHQRNSISRAFSDLDDNDLILVSDVDEIPNPTMLRIIKDDTSIHNRLLGLIMDFYYYNLTCRHFQKCVVSKIFSLSFYKNIKSTIQNLRFEYNDNDLYIDKGGWHLSYFGDVSFISTKLRDFCHQEYNTDKYNNTDNIENCIKGSKDLFGREDNPITKIRIEDNDNLPPMYDIYLKKFIS